MIISPRFGVAFSTVIEGEINDLFKLSIAIICLGFRFIRAFKIRIIKECVTYLQQKCQISRKEKYLTTQMHVEMK